jgi:hypothetical protein
MQTWKLDDALKARVDDVKADKTARDIRVIITTSKKESLPADRLLRLGILVRRPGLHVHLASVSIQDLDAMTDQDWVEEIEEDIQHRRAGARK